MDPQADRYLIKNVPSDASGSSYAVHKKLVIKKGEPGFISISACLLA
jgi:hypothetical protein